MRTNIYTSKIISRWLTLVLCILLTIITISSCSNMKSVRSGEHLNLDKNAKPKESTNKIIPEQNQNLKEFEQKILNKKSIPETTQPTLAKSTINNEDRLPTLREQMQIIATDNKQILIKIDTINSKIENLNDNINFIKDYLDNNPLKSNDNTMKGNISNSKREILPDNIKKETYIDSDEEVSKNLEKNTSKQSRTKLIKTNSKEKSSKKKEKSIQKQSVIVKNSLSESKPNENIAKIVKKVNNPVSPSNPVDLKNLVLTEKNPSTVNDYNFQLGESSFKSQDYASTIIYLKKVITSKNPNKKDRAHGLLAEANMKLGRVADAKLAYENLIKNFPESDMVPKARKMLQQL